MRISVAQASSVIAIAAVAVLGTQYANAAPGHDTHTAIAAVRNIAHVYATTTPGGTGEVTLSIPTPANGVYEASFAANFFPEGTPAAPETFSCSIIKNGTIMRTQSTVTTTYSSGFYAGVNGSNTIKVNTGDTFGLNCGVADGTAWTWGTLPAQVTLTRLDGLTTGSLSKMGTKAGSLSTLTTR